METAENKSLIKKILYVIVTLLPMAIYMVIYMPTFFWVESLTPANGFHIIHTAIDDMIPSSFHTFSGFLTSASV